MPGIRSAAFNEVPAAGEVALFTDGYGPFTPLVRGATLVVLFPFPAAVPGNRPARRRSAR